MCPTLLCHAFHGVQLRGVMPSMCLTLLCHACHGVQLRGVMPAMVSNSAVSCYRRVYLSLFLEEIVIDYIFTSLSVAQMGLIDEKRRVENLLPHSLLRVLNWVPQIESLATLSVKSVELGPTDRISCHTLC